MTKKQTISSAFMCIKIEVQVSTRYVMVIVDVNLFGYCKSNNFRANYKYMPG